MMEASAEESGRPPARNQYTLTTGAIHRRCSDSSPSGKACSPMLPRKHFHIVCARFDVPTSSRQSTLCVRHQNLFLLLRNGNRMHLVTQTLHTHHTLLAPTRLSSHSHTRLGTPTMSCQKWLLLLLLLLLSTFWSAPSGPPWQALSLPLSAPAPARVWCVEHPLRSGPEHPLRNGPRRSEQHGAVREYRSPGP